MGIAVRFVPPYTNKPKLIPCEDVREAKMLAAWLDGLGATPTRVEIVSVSTVETVIK
jgi:hypothetical protein